MISYFARHPTAANLLMLGLLAFGLMAAPSLLRETFPRIEARKVQISVTYQGARPEDIEEAICRRIENALEAVSNVEEVACEARENIAVATAEMSEGKDIDRFLAEVSTEIEAIKDFPENAEKPVVKQLGRTDFVASVAITGALNKTELKAYAEQVKSAMAQWGGIPQTSIKGFSDHQIRITLADTTLRQFGLSVGDIATAISRQSLDLPAGSITTGEQEILLRYADERKKLFEFLDLVVISGTQGGQIRLGDIAKIEDRFDLDEEKILFNGQLAAMIDISKTENDDTLSVIDAVNAFVASEQASAPSGVKLQVTKDVSSIVRDRLQLLVKNGLQGLFLVFLMMWLFFGLRYSFWIAMGLPVSFMGAIGVMVLLGMSLNMMTMVALIIVIGLLMDDAIVIAENIAAQREQGKKPIEAAIDGTRQVLPGVMSSFGTTACIFGSLMFLAGDLGAIIRVIPIVMLSVVPGD